jgi:acyl carrier protein
MADFRSVRAAGGRAGGSEPGLVGLGGGRQSVNDHGAQPKGSGSKLSECLFEEVRPPTTLAVAEASSCDTRGLQGCFDRRGNCSVVTEQRPENRGQLQNRVLEIIAAKINRPIEDIPLDKSFESLGFESMDAFELLFALEDELGVSLPDDKARTLNTVNGLVDCLVQELKL